MSYRDSLVAMQARIDALEQERAVQYRALADRDRQLTELRDAARSSSTSPITARERALVAELETTRRALALRSSHDALHAERTARPRLPASWVVFLVGVTTAIVTIAPWLTHR